MAQMNKISGVRWCKTILLLLCSTTLLQQTQARDVKYINGVGLDGVTRQLEVDRQPALFTQDFGDCLGGQSLFNITRFDAAFYTDNSTVLFHLDGTTNIKNESLMLHISMDAYGQRRFDQTFDPCYVNIYSLCPLNASNPIAAWALFQIGPQQIGDIPTIAFSIPDFDGTVTLQIFANSSQTEIGCFQASMSNGNSMGHPEAIAPALGAIALFAVLASFLTAVYGVSVPHMRSHYAHSISAVIVFETFQSIFLTGMLNLNWPSIVVSWWSNFAWAAGQIYSSSIISAVNKFEGISGNSSQAGGAGSTVINTGGGLASQIYGRSLLELTAESLEKRQPYNASDPFDYTWDGDPVGPGIPLPGNGTGFALTLGNVHIPAADAFVVGLIWTMVAIAGVFVAATFFKLTLEAMAKIKVVRHDRLAYFRSHWVKYAILAGLRTMLGAFFLVMTLAFFHFTIAGPAAGKAIAGVTIAVFLVGIGGAVAYGTWSRLRHGTYSRQLDRVMFVHTKILGCLPFIAPRWSSSFNMTEQAPKAVGSFAMSRIVYRDQDAARTPVTEDVAFIKQFGWLFARYRRTQWWFPACYVPYLLIRAAILGGAASNPTGQVYGLFIFDILAFLAFVRLNPFEGQRNTALAIWMLGLVKLVTSGLAIALLPSMGLSRILVTVIGVAIIIAQGFLVVGLIILVLLGAFSSYMSLTRNREHFTPEGLEGLRVKYFEAMQTRTSDAPREKAQPKQKPDYKGKHVAVDNDEPEKPREPYFAVSTVRRAPKIEDEDDDVIADLDAPHNNSGMFDPNRIANRASRGMSVSSRRSTHSLSGMGHTSRASWSSKDFAEWDTLNRQREEMEGSTSVSRRLSLGGSRNMLLTSSNNNSGILAGSTSSGTAAAAAAAAGGGGGGNSAPLLGLQTDEMMVGPFRHGTPLQSTPEAMTPAGEVPPVLARTGPIRTMTPRRNGTPAPAALEAHVEERAQDLPAP